MTLDPYDLQRFITAQATTFDAALAELKTGRKRSHWMWFIFPQMKGLGHSPTAQFYGITGLDEARDYLAHPVLGPRLEAVTQAVLAHPGRTLNEIFGAPDDMKFRSSMTLFDLAFGRPDNPYRQALETFSGGRLDGATLALLG